MRGEIIQVLKKALIEKHFKLKEEEIDKILEIPPSHKMGDYAFPCFLLAKKFKQNPNKIALEIKDKITNPPKDLKNIQTSGPYINFFINRKKMAEKIIKKIIKQEGNFGKRDLGQGQKALIEHTSINPNASPHVGRARNAIIGDSIVRILNFLNFKTEVHYYVNDVSKQIAMLVLAKQDNLKFESMLKKYVEISAKVKKSKKLEKQVFELLLKFEQGDKKITKEFQKITNISIKGQKKILKEIGINYDFFDYESKYLKKSSKLLSKLEKTKKLFTDKDQRKVVDLRNTPIEKQMKSPVLVLTRSDGTGLYPLRDLSYTIEKMKRAKKNIIILGEDQKLYFQQIKQTLSFLNLKSPEVIHYSFILLNKKGKSKKMSTRKGDIVLLEDFLRDAIKKAKNEIDKRKTKGDARKIGIGAVKYAILKNNNNKIIHFDLNEALNFEGDTGPYIMYSYARASSILRKTENKNKFNISKLEEKEFKLVKKISQFPEIVLDSYKNFNPAIIANYSYQLAQIFNEFYHACPVINSKQESFRLALVKSFRQVLKNSLDLLGIDAIEKM